MGSYLTHGVVFLFFGKISIALQDLPALIEYEFLQKVRLSGWY